LLPGVGAPVRTVTCLYTLTPDRDFVLGAVPGHEAVVLGLGAGHGFKFAPTFGRVLADLVTEGATASDVSDFAVDRPALTQADYPVSWLV
jgi:sarcosine oxidase